MNELVIAERRALVRAHPERMREEQAQADAMIQTAAAMQCWPELEHAVDIKLAQQQEFVAWWAGRVRSQGEVRKKFPSHKFLSVPELEKQTRIDASQVSH